MLSMPSAFCYSVLSSLLFSLLKTLSSFFQFALCVFFSTLIFPKRKECQPHIQSKYNYVCSSYSFRFDIGQALPNLFCNIDDSILFVNIFLKNILNCYFFYVFFVFFKISFWEAGLIFTTTIPIHTKTSARRKRGPSKSFSLSSIAERITPIAGLVNPKTDILDTSLLRSRMPHRV